MFEVNRAGVSGLRTLDEVLAFGEWTRRVE